MAINHESSNQQCTVVHQPLIINHHQLTVTDHHSSCLYHPQTLFLLRIHIDFVIGWIHPEYDAYSRWPALIIGYNNHQSLVITTNIHQPHTIKTGSPDVLPTVYIYWPLFLWLRTTPEIHQPCKTTRNNWYLPFISGNTSNIRTSSRSPHISGKVSNTFTVDTSNILTFRRNG